MISSTVLFDFLDFLSSDCSIRGRGWFVLLTAEGLPVVSAFGVVFLANFLGLISSTADAILRASSTSSCTEDNCTVSEMKTYDRLYYCNNIMLKVKKQNKHNCSRNHTSSSQLKESTSSGDPLRKIMTIARF